MSDSPTKIVRVGDHTVEITIETSDVPRTIQVTVRSDTGRTWTSLEPGWRELRFGSGNGWTFGWSARRVFALHEDSTRSSPICMAADEDILGVFVVDHGWLLVCETSVRLQEGNVEVARIELGDVVDEVEWEGPDLTVRDARGHVVRIRPLRGGLQSQDC